MKYLTSKHRFNADDDSNFRFEFVYNDKTLATGCYKGIPDFSQEYVLDVIKAPGVVIKNGSFFNGDYKSRHVNVAQGMRLTVGNPQHSQHTIYMMGSSTAFGSLCEDGHTVASHLQKMCNNMLPGKYKVLNYGTRGAFLQLHALQIPYLPIKKDDVVIVMGLTWYDIDSYIVRNLHLMCQERQARFCFLLTHTVHGIHMPSEREKLLQSNYYQALAQAALGQKVQLYNDFHHIHGKYIPEPIVSQLATAGCPCIDLLPYLNRPHKMGEIFIDKVHLCSRGNQTIAEAVFDGFIRQIQQDSFDRKQAMESSYDMFRQWVNIFIHNEQGLHQWLQQVRQSGFVADKGGVGAIVMNCNPFTLGHLYLIEQALKRVENLYVFVVEEDLSEFKFKDRLELVRQGVAHLGGRVKVFGAGNFIISTKTFPEYFDKTSFEDQPVDTTNDLAIFAVGIAPRLNIKQRFIGQEPYCQVTSQYNESMKRILPNLGIQVLEMPRLESDGQAISASMARQYIAENNWDELQALVPKTTYDFLEKKFKTAQS